MDDTFSKNQLGFGILRLCCESISLLLCVEVMYTNFFAPYTDHNLHQSALLRNVSRDNFFSVWLDAIGCSCTEHDIRVRVHI